MLAKANTTEVHERRHRVLIDRHELERIVTRAVCEHLGVSHSDNHVTVKITFEDATEGSPAYRIGTKAIVDVQEDLMEAPRKVLPPPK